MPNKIKALLVDDEPMAIERLYYLLNDYREQIQVLGHANNGKEALQKIEKLKPDVLFLDIEMPGMNGFELLRNLTVLPDVVFVTAYDQYAVRAFEENSVDYLLKPIEAKRLFNTIKKLTSRDKSNLADRIEVLEKLVLKKEEMKILPVKIGPKIELVRTNLIIYLESKEKYVTVHTRDKNFLVDYTLTYLANQLPDYFLQISRSAIINKENIKRILKYSGKSYIFELENGERTKLKSGSTYYEELKVHFSL